MCWPDLALLGDAASCEGVCSQRRQRKPSCTGNHPRYDGRLSEVHQPSKCVSIYGFSLCLVKFIDHMSNWMYLKSFKQIWFSVSLTVYYFIMWVCGCVASFLCFISVTGKRPCRMQKLLRSTWNVYCSLLERYGVNPGTHQTQMRLFRLVLGLNEIKKIFSVQC